MSDQSQNRTTDRNLSGAPDNGPLSAREAAELLGLAERTIRRAVGAGVLAATKRAGVYRIEPEELARYQRQRGRGRDVSSDHIHPRPTYLIALPGGRQRSASILPRSLVPMIGRQPELAAVRALLSHGDVALVTLTGPGGVGKTRLAQAVGVVHAADTGKEAVFVSLAPFHEADLVVPAVCHALGIQVRDELPQTDRIALALQNRTVLLILDNLEHVLAAAPHLADILAACPTLTILATSRAPLWISGERIVPIPPMTVPDPSRSLSLAEFERTDSIALFTARARAANPRFELTEANARIVAAICTRLDGLPLAIELAATRTPVLSLQAILYRLDRRFELLAHNAGDQPPRLRSLHDAIAWSHDLLAPDEQLVFRRLAVFAGGCTLEAAEALCGEPGVHVLDCITTLVFHSLLVRVEQPDDTARYAMLETIREFARERLETSGEFAALRAAHAAYFTSLVREVQLGYYTPEIPDPSHLLFVAEEPNVRRALAWEAEHGESALLLYVVSIGWWSWLPGAAAEWLERAIAGESHVAPGQRPLLLAAAADYYASSRHDIGRATALVDACLSIAGEPDDAKAMALAAICQAIIADREGDLGRARLTATDALERWTALNESSWRTLEAMQRLGRILLHGGDTAGAETLIAEALRVATITNAEWTLPSNLEALGACALARGDGRRAAALLAECLTMIWDGWGIFGPVRSYTFFWSTAAGCLDTLGIVAAGMGDGDVAARFGGAAEALRERRGERLSPLQREWLDRAISPPRNGTHGATFAGAWEAGRALSPEVACTEGLAFAESLLAAAPRQRPRSGLTRREREVVREIAAGHSNRAIAQTLSISERTVEVHVLHILTKLGLESRSAAAAWAVRHGLA